MLLAFIQLLAVIGFICTLITWWAGNDLLAMVVGVAGSFAWGLVAYGLFNVETLDSTATQSEPALALFATAFVVITFLPALVEPFELIGESRGKDDPWERI